MALIFTTAACAARRAGCSIGVGLALSACSPGLDWRELKLADTGLTAQLPCRPSQHARPVSLAGAPRTLNLWSCSTGSTTWGLAWIEDVEPNQLGDTLAALRQGALRNVQAADAAPAPFQIPGAMSHPQAGRLRALGRRPDGSEIQQEQALFVKGKTVFQATLLAPPMQVVGAEEFFGALRFTP